MLKKKKRSLFQTTKYFRISLQAVLLCLCVIVPLYYANVQSIIKDAGSNTRASLDICINPFINKLPKPI